MIISLRGTSGSGKSSLVRVITSHYDGGGVPFYVDGRKHCYYTIWTRPGGAGPSLMVPGHYEIANGGIDTLKTLDEAYALAREFDDRGHDVLMEGKNMSDGTRRLLALCAERRDARVVHLDVSPQRCLESVRARGHDIAMFSIRKTYEKCLRDMRKFTSADVTTFSGSRGSAREVVKRWLKVDQYS